MLCACVYCRKVYKPSDNYQMELVDELNAALCDCIRHHQYIVQCCKLLENLSSPFVLVKSIQISFQICLLALSFVKVQIIVLNSQLNYTYIPIIWQTTGSISDTIVTAQYIALTIFDLFVLSYTGQTIHDQVDSI